MKIKNVDLNSIHLTANEISWQLRHAKAEGFDAVYFSFKETGSQVSFTVLINQEAEDPKKIVEKLHEKELEREPEDEEEDDTDE